MQANTCRIVNGYTHHLKGTIFNGDTILRILNDQILNVSIVIPSYGNTVPTGILGLEYHGAIGLTHNGQRATTNIQAGPGFKFQNSTRFNDKSLSLRDNNRLLNQVRRGSFFQKAT